MRLCPDEWLAALGAYLFDEPLRARPERVLTAHAFAVLGLGRHVVLEFGFWTRAERDALRVAGRAAGPWVELRYLDPPFDELVRRVESRVDDPAAGSVRLTRELMLSYRPLFEAPDRAELALFDGLGPAGSPLTREDGDMTEEDIIAHVAALPGVVAYTPDETSEAPEIAWGDTFVFYDPDDSAGNRAMPFATIVTKDYPGFDAESRLDRPGAFRLNISVGREAFADLIGHSPADHAQHHGRFDYAAADRVLPHPAYATQSWVSIVNPAGETEALARELLTAAHARAVHRYRPRNSTAPDQD